VLYANRSFEELFECALPRLLAPGGVDHVMSAVESRAFFGLVAQLMNGESITNEAMVECISQRSGLFLCHVVFHSFVDGADRQHKCACIFSDPLFYLPILECPSNVVALLEYVESENDCIVLRVNRSASGGLQQADTGAESWAAKNLRRDIGFVFDAADVAFFTRCQFIGRPLVKRFRVEPRLTFAPHGMWLAATGSLLCAYRIDFSLSLLSMSTILII
jgi:hypothetical protein